MRTVMFAHWAVTGARARLEAVANTDSGPKSDSGREAHTGPETHTVVSVDSTAKTSKRWGALAGIAAAAVAIGVAEMVAVVTGPRSAPLLAVDGVVVDKIPGPA